MGRLLIGDPAGTHVHTELMKGTPQQAREYCQKEDTRISTEDWKIYCEANGIDQINNHQGPHEWGEWPVSQQGKRNDIHDFTDELAKGKTLAEVALANPVPFVKYHGGFGKLAFLLQQKAAMGWRDVKVKVLYGSTGVGKTRQAIKEAIDLDGGWFLQRKDDGKTMWWDGYDGQFTIILDELHGNWCTYKALLGILDGQPLRLPVKGGHVWASYENIIITSSGPPHSWYAREEYSELDRRIDEVIHLDPLRAAMPALGVPVPKEAQAPSGGNNGAPLFRPIRVPSPPALDLNDLTAWSGPELTPNIHCDERLSSSPVSKWQKLMKANMDEWAQQYRAEDGPLWEELSSDTEESFLMSE